jgi:hypothetical protein
MKRVIVADRAIDDDAGDPTPLRMRCHHLADQRIGEVAAPVHNDDIAGLGDVERLVDHEVVAGPGLDRECGTGEHAALVDRSKCCAARGHPRHGIADICAGQLTEFRDNFRINLAHAFANLKSNHRQASSSCSGCSDH